MNMEGKEPVSQVAFLDSRFQEQQRLPLDSFGHHTFQGLLDSQSLYMIMDKEGGGKSLLVIDRKSGEMEDVPFTQREISGLLDRGDQLQIQSKQGVSIPEGSYASLLFVNKNATPAK